MTQIPIATQATLDTFEADQTAAVAAQVAASLDSKSQAAAGVGTWVGNLTGYNLGKWQHTPAARLNVVSIGHSIALGNNATTPYTNGFANLTRSWLQRTFGDGGFGLYFLGRPEWTASAGWSNTSFGPHGVCRFVIDNATPTFTLTGVVGDTMDIIYLDVPLAGPITYTVDGGAPQTAAVAGAGDTGTKRVSVSLGTLATHTIVFKGPASGKFYFCGAAVYKGTTGAVLHDWALGGATTGSVGNPTDKLAGLSLLSPNLVIILLMINDHYQQIALGTFSTNLNAIIDAAQVAGSEVLLLLEPDIQETFAVTQRDYEATAKAIAVAQGIPWACFADLWGDYTANASRMGDTVHPNLVGHTDMATTLIRLLKAA